MGTARERIVTHIMGTEIGGRLLLCKGHMHTVPPAGAYALSGSAGVNVEPYAIRILSYLFSPGWPPAINLYPEGQASNLILTHAILVGVTSGSTLITALYRMEEHKPLQWCASARYVRTAQYMQHVALN